MTIDEATLAKWEGLCEADTAFVIAARRAMPQLIAEVRRLRKELNHRHDMAMDADEAIADMQQELGRLRHSCASIANADDGEQEDERQG